jgi:hypothetical protein
MAKAKRTSSPGRKIDRAGKRGFEFAAKLREKEFKP